LHLDHCNAVLAGLLAMTAPLQRILHAAAHTVLDLKLGDHVTPALRELHWLPITERIQYKLCLLVHKMFVGHAANYIASLLTPASDIPSWSLLRSSSMCLGCTKSESENWWQGFLCCRTPCLESAADRLETLASDCFIQEQTEEFYVSCCLHREHYVNSGMRHWSDCSGRTTGHCCYCYCYWLKQYKLWL